VPREPQIGEPLPGAAEAVIPRAKLVDYALDPDHPRGRHKAVVFKTALGIGRLEWRQLHDQILGRLPHEPVSSWRRAHGPRPASWRVVIPITGPNGRTVRVVTAWKLVEGTPHLTSLFVSRTRGQARGGRT
jgi:hypothetical protein